MSDQKPALHGIYEGIGMEEWTLEQLVELAEKEVSAICQGKKWRMCIPTQRDDSDALIGSALRAQAGRIKDLELELAGKGRAAEKWEEIAREIIEEAEDIIPDDEGNGYHMFCRLCHAGYLEQEAHEPYCQVLELKKMLKETDEEPKGAK